MNAPKRIKYKGQIYEAIENEYDETETDITVGDDFEKVFSSIDTSTHVWKPTDFFNTLERLANA